MSIHRNVAKAAKAAEEVVRLEKLIATLEHGGVCRYDEYNKRLIIFPDDEHTYILKEFKASPDAMKEAAQEIHDTLLALLKCQLEEARVQFMYDFAD